MLTLITAAVVDDNKDTVEVFTEYLRIYKVNIVAVGYNGKDAVDIYKKYKPDVVFVDMIMPQYDGIYAIKEIRALDPNANIIVVTADLSKDAEDKLSVLRPTGIIFKPFEMNRVVYFLDKISKAFPYF